MRFQRGQSDMTTLAVVTGGSGYIGSNLVRNLLCHGRSVRILDLAAPPRDLAPEVEWVSGSILNQPLVTKTLKGAHELYHLAANPKLWTLKKGDFDKINHQGAREVLNAACGLKIPKILHCSTESILTLSRQKNPIRENQLVSMADVIGPYCRSKFRAERHAFYLASQGHPVFIVNPTLPVGPGDLQLSPPSRLIVDFCRGKRREYLDASLNFMDVRDMAMAMRLTLDRGVPGRRYILGAHNTEIRGLFQLLSEITGVPIPKWKVPYSLALSVACISEIVANILTKTEPLASITGVLLTRRTMHFDSSNTFQELGLIPRPLKATLKDAITWWRKEGIL